MMKIIACEMFKPYIQLLHLELDIVYIEIEGHNYPKKLARRIQKEIDQATHYEKILLLYGLCGNTLLHIKARDVPVYVVKVHDCLSILLGSKKRFKQLFQKRLSCNWSCYSLEKESLTFDEYDEETRAYLESILNVDKDVYISFSMNDEREYEKKYKEIIEGDLSFLKDIINLDSTELLKIQKDDDLKFDEHEIIIKEKR